MTVRAPVIAWFRQDLRLQDNPALAHAADSGCPVLPVYILDDAAAADRRMGSASRWWLHHSLVALDCALDGALLVLRGRADELLPALARSRRARGVVWNRCYEPWRIERDRGIRASLADSGVVLRTFNASLLFEPPGVTKADGTPYRVFTPFFRYGCLGGQVEPRALCRLPAGVRYAPVEGGCGIDGLDLVPRGQHCQFADTGWQPGEAGAQRQLQHFLDDGLPHYREGRDRPDCTATSRLSPHLHFGELSPHQLWRAVTEAPPGNSDAGADLFKRELGWREFSYNLLYHWPALTHRNLQRKFDRFPWHDDGGALEAWQHGRTGYPMVDAGMRELLQTGYMHNRLRMLTGSFLVKNLLQHWRHGEAWFRDKLVDADLANNSVGWQWVAGTGADAVPYFRIFNPVTQGRKFDPCGDYVRRYLPALAALPDRYVHEPWAAPNDVLGAAGVVPGRDYPHPIVDLKASRERALAAFRTLSRPAASSAG